MRVLDPYYQFESPTSPSAIRGMLELIEAAGRTCYKSEHNIGRGTASKFVRKIAQVKKHESVLEHASISVRIICDRGVSHELVRHRIAAFSQESTRYCNYCKDVFGAEIAVIRPFFFSPASVEYNHWIHACQQAEDSYRALLHMGATPQQARSVLPNSLKTEIVMTCNLREWKHVFRMRCAESAHPQMRQIMLPLWDDFRRLLPEIYDDLDVPMDRIPATPWAFRVGDLWQAGELR